ncbi:MAG: glucose 1-dehydrogenase [Kiloniellales bacterium]
MRLAGKVALVTGAGSGFGAEIARRFAAEGAAMLVADVDETNGRSVTGAIAGAGGRAYFEHCDVARQADIAAAVAATERAFGGLDILVNNAGVSHSRKGLLEVTEEEFDRIFAVNVKAIYFATLAAVPRLAARGGGVILNVSSTAAARPRPGLTWYNASKGAVSTATQSMAVELAPQKIRVNALCPVIGETALLETFMGCRDSPEARASFLAGIPLGRFSTPADVAAGALFLASDEAAFLTGVCLPVDGGRSV